MHLCLLSDNYPPSPGGLAISTQRLAHGLVLAGHEVTVCVLSSKLLAGQVQRQESAMPQLHLYHVGRHKKPADSYTSWFEAVIHLHEQNPFDLLHGYYLVEAGFVTVYAARYLGLPSIVSARGNDLDRTLFDPNRTSAILWAVTQAHVVTTVSSDLARKARALAPNQHVVPLFNGVDGAKFCPMPVDLALKARLGLGEGPLIGFVGEARLKKGLTILLLAFAKLVAETEWSAPPHLLLIGGVRADDADLVRVFQAQHPHLLLHIIPYTSHATLPAYYNLLDLLVLPSLREGLPNSLLEGMACQRAVIATPVGGIPDVLRHLENGYLVPPGEVEALTVAMKTLLQQPETRAHLGQAARETVLRDFTLSRELTQNIELYQHVMSTLPQLSAIVYQDLGLL